MLIQDFVIWEQLIKIAIHKDVKRHQNILFLLDLGQEQLIQHLLVDLHQKKKQVKMINLLKEELETLFIFLSLSVREHNHNHHHWYRQKVFQLVWEAWLTHEFVKWDLILKMLDLTDVYLKLNIQFQLSQALEPTQIHQLVAYSPKK